MILQIFSANKFVRKWIFKSVQINDSSWTKLDFTHECEKNDTRDIVEKFLVLSTTQNLTRFFFFYFRDVWAKKFSTPSHMYRLFADWNFSFILSVLIYVPYPFRMRAIMALHTFLLFVALSNFQPFMIIVFIFFLILPFIHSSWQTSRLLTILFNQ